MSAFTFAAEYRYFSFTYYYGKAYFGWAENEGVRACSCQRSPVHDDPQPDRLRVFFVPFI